ncbi:MAG: isocyanide synthase family protein [Actinomycetota bacterium]|nr:isocyanide synthase family protein [Actinomycetota bacterium]
MVPGDAGRAASQVLRLLFSFRRVASASDPCARRPCGTCFAVHRSKIDVFIDKGEPIHFVLPAFPAKSPNPQKVLGALPDMAEDVALGFLQSFCHRVSRLYPPGARITICSDGHVFSDVVGVSDFNVCQYRRELWTKATKNGCSSLDMFSLEDAFGGDTYAEMRQALESRFAMTIDQIRKRIRADADWLRIFNGLHRFVFEDQLALRPGCSRNKLRTECKELAYQLIQRSNAWSQLMADTFPDAVRLSIHPQRCHSAKVGFHLIHTRDNWLTPWHGVVLDHGDEFILLKRADAEQMGASLIWRNNRPSHFLAPTIKGRRPDTHGQARRFPV